jgi:hypothetical protein
MKNTMATKQKITATRAIKTSETVSLRSGPLPVYKVAAKSLIDPSEFIPIADGKKAAGGGVKLLRRIDLFPKKAVQLHATREFDLGQTLLDEFSPIYGSYHFLRPSYFQFQFSKLMVTFADKWRMNSLANELEVLIYPRSLQPLMGFPGNYVKILLGETNNRILTVKINNTQFNLDLSNSSNQFFDLWLIDNSPDYLLELKLLPSGEGVCEIKSIRLYDTIRIPQLVFGA